MRSLMVAGSLAALFAVPAAAQQQQAPPPNAQTATSTQGSAEPRAATPEQQDAEARKKLEAEIAKELGGKAASPPVGAQQGVPGATPGAPGAAPGATGGNPMARLLLLPDVSAIGSFAGAYDTYDVEGLSPREGLFGPKGKPQPLFQELELGLQSVIDPYARADIFISFTPEGAEVEEAYLTTLDLPGGLQVRAGKFFSLFGRQNTQHPHVWDFVDAPLARGRLVASEVLSGPGVDVAWLAPLPWFTELHLAGQATAPAPDDPERLTAVARLLQYVPLGEATTLGVGLSAARRSEATGAFRDLGAVDAYLRWRPIQGRSYLTVQGELYGRKFRNVEGGSDAGGYAQLFWRQDAYLGYGVRYDEAPAAGDAAPGTERRVGALATWFPSEFQRLRLQVSYDRRPGGHDGVEALLALELGIGAHGAHPF
jgi:hypothetical protein